MERATGKIGIPHFCNHQNDKLQLPKSEAFAIKRMLKTKARLPHQIDELLLYNQ